MSISDPLRLGVVGLGRGFALSARAIAAHPGLRLVGAADPDEESCRAVQRAFGGRIYGDIAALAGDPDIEAIYICTPHHLHRDHALTALRAGKHVLVEKPMAVTLAEADAMIDAAQAGARQLIVGPSHSFDGPVRLAAEMIAAGAIGAVKMIHALYATDFLYRPRRAEELAGDLGGGAVLGQAIHQIDVVRRLAGVPAQRVTARTGGAWDPARRVEGAYAMLVDFDGGIFATLTYSGHGHFDGDRLLEGISELGIRKPDRHGATRPRLHTTADEAAARRARRFTRLEDCPQPETHEHFGQVIVFGTQGDLRLTPEGVELSDAQRRSFHPAPFTTPRAEVFDALYAAIRHGKAPLQDGAWGRASLEICLAALAGARSGAVQPLQFQR
ncbi:Gfo/Idh/MocA family protein [Pararhodobacter oceanensis]|uniref:Gfo/Idh/MocA family protein n=1 Tax=Pararhodobacter oceanensis TaxID=2172121 RepID=UPI003A91B4CC